MVLMSMMESSKTKANILFLLGKEMDQGKLRGMPDEQTDDADNYKKTDRLLGDDVKHHVITY